MEYISKEQIINELIRVGTMTGTAMSLGLSYKAFRFLCKEYDIDYSLYIEDTRADLRQIDKDILENEVFANKKFIHTRRLRELLVKYGYKEEICEICGIKDWNNKKLVLQLHHIDGNRYNNDISNLLIVCPNCHSQEPYFRGSNKLTAEEKAKLTNINPKPVKIKTEPKPKKPRGTVKTCKVCGKEFISPNGTFCSIACSEEYKRKNIPSKEEIIATIPLYKSARTLCTHWNVTDNALKRWLKRYDINIYDYGYRKLGDKSNTYK